MGTATNSFPVSPRNKALSLKRIGWLYPIFRDVYFYHGLLGTRAAIVAYDPKASRAYSEGPSTIQATERFAACSLEEGTLSTIQQAVPATDT